jgi:hypothetical protein
MTYWYLTKHGVQPGSIPKNTIINMLLDFSNGTYFSTDRVLSTKELNEYDLSEASPKEYLGIFIYELRDWNKTRETYTRFEFGEYRDLYDQLEELYLNKENSNHILYKVADYMKNNSEYNKIIYADFQEIMNIAHNFDMNYLQATELYYDLHLYS